VEPCRQKDSNNIGRLAGTYPSTTWLPRSAYGKSSHKDFLWRAGLLVWEVQQLGESRALLSEGAAELDLGEIFGPLKEGDTVLRRGSGEIREGTRLKVRLTPVSKG
jgi:hypothetical protein